MFLKQLILTCLTIQFLTTKSGSNDEMISLKSHLIFCPFHASVIIFLRLLVKQLKQQSE